MFQSIKRVEYGREDDLVDKTNNRRGLLGLGMLVNSRDGRGLNDLNGLAFLNNRDVRHYWL